MSELVFEIREYRRDDRKGVFHLLRFLPQLYPRSFDWLDGRLTNVEQGRASCLLAIVNHRFTGILIDTPKGRRTSKISTFFVENKNSGKGVGANLFNKCALSWKFKGIDNVYVTVPNVRRSQIEPFLQLNGFEKMAQIPDRYGPGRTEIVYASKIL